LSISTTDLLAWERDAWSRILSCKSNNNAQVAGVPRDGGRRATRFALSPRVWEPDLVNELFAHQGGWDEMLFVAVPIAIFAGLLVIANRRASRIEQRRRSDEPPPGEPDRRHGGPPA
jgi:hypothetical protein